MTMCQPVSYTHLDVYKRQTLNDILALIPQRNYAPVGAIVNNELQELDYPLYTDSTVTWVDISTSTGWLIYRRSLTFLLLLAVHECFPDHHLWVSHSLSLIHISTAQKALNDLVYQLEQKQKVDGSITNLNLEASRKKIAEQQKVVNELLAESVNAEITAPMAGIVTTINVAAGQTTSAVSYTHLDIAYYYLIANN